MLRLAKTGWSWRKRSAGLWWPLSPRKSNFSGGGPSAGRGATTLSATAAASSERVIMATALRSPVGKVIAWGHCRAAGAAGQRPSVRDQSSRRKDLSLGKARDAGKDLLLTLAGAAGCEGGERCDQGGPGGVSV